MEGTVLITGANESLALKFVDQLPSSYPAFTLIGTTRNTSDQGPHAAKLNGIISKYPDRKGHIEKLDLNSANDDRSLNQITVVTMDPVGLTNSRAHDEQQLFARVMLSVFKLITPILKYVNSDIRSTSKSTSDLVEVTVGADFRNIRGYFKDLQARGEASISEYAQKQDLLWKSSWKWAELIERGKVI
ncbi:hypothetical protein ETB97_009856 [Aspergillus alliaceus]|uniref:Uncharacterized protein n=1 Tax=Petromyces alliaceus TaxID=209559 RepID=A0A8H6E0T0_PETAA|nr:hypothetical protein ETB97_009856 [Aspergillus burnettii]